LPPWPPAATRRQVRRDAGEEICSSSYHPSFAVLLSHPNKDLVLAKGQHRAATRARPMHDHAGAVFEPQIAAAGRAETSLAGALRVSARKIGDAGELVDGAGRSDFLSSLTDAGPPTIHITYQNPAFLRSFLAV